MEKPPNMGDYDGKGDPDENLQLVKERLNYYNVEDASKCKLFALSLVRPTRLLFNDLLDEFIKSWTYFCDLISIHFTARTR